MRLRLSQAKQGQVEEALTCARGISDDRAKSSALKGISGELAKQGQVEEAASAMQEASVANWLNKVAWKRPPLRCRKPLTAPVG